MKFSQSQRVDRAGVSLISHLTSEELGWIFREQGTSDVGIDAHLEIVENTEAGVDSGDATGRLLAIQIKSGLSYFARRSQTGWWLLCDAPHIEYWLRHSLPVVVIIYNPGTRIAYWQHVARENLTRSGANWKIHIPEANRFGRQAGLQLEPLARQRVEEDPFRLALNATQATGDENSRHARFEAYIHLLCARIVSLFPNSRLGRPEQDISGAYITFHFEGWMVDIVAIREGASGIDELFLERSHPLRIAPTVFIASSPSISITPPASESIFIAHWHDKIGDDQLKSALSGALGHIRQKFLG